MNLDHRKHVRFGDFRNDNFVISRGALTIAAASFLAILSEVKEVVQKN